VRVAGARRALLSRATGSFPSCAVLVLRPASKDAAPRNTSTRTALSRQSPRRDSATLSSPASLLARIVRRPRISMSSSSFWRAWGRAGTAPATGIIVRAGLDCCPVPAESPSEKNRKARSASLAGKENLCTHAGLEFLECGRSVVGATIAQQMRVCGGVGRGIGSCPCGGLWMSLGGT
jgi:hypothetical protein